MHFIKLLSIYVMPFIILFIITSGIIKKVDIFDAFISGAGEGLKITAKIAPALIGLLAAVKMLRASGALDALIFILTPFAKFFHIPPELLPLAVLRPISGSGSLALVSDIFKSYGTDSIISKTAAVIMGSTETTFYAISVYFGSVGVKNTRHTLKCALIADFTALLFGVYISRVFFV